MGTTDMEDRRQEAKTARDRALEAIPGSDFGTQRALWKMALKFHADAKISARQGQALACAIS
jgi:hypothetical protein